MNKEQVLITESVELNINGKMVIVKFPSKISQQLDIESQKALLSYGKYAILSATHINSSERVLDMIDMFAHFMAVVPNFNSLVGLDKVGNPMDLEISMVKPLVKEFNTVYARFYNQFVEADERIGSLEIRLEAEKFDNEKSADKPTTPIEGLDETEGAIKVVTEDSN